MFTASSAAAAPLPWLSRGSCTAVQSKGSPSRCSRVACWAAVGRTRRISALNYGFFARLIDLERRLNGPYALAGLSCEPSINLLDYVRLPLLDASQFAFRPVPTLAELVEESRHDENEPGASKRQAALRRLMRNLRFVLVQLQASSPACARALAALMEG